MQYILICRIKLVFSTRTLLTLETFIIDIRNWPVETISNDECHGEVGSNFYLREKMGMANHLEPILYSGICSHRSTFCLFENIAFPGRQYGQ